MSLSLSFLSNVLFPKQFWVYRKGNQRVERVLWWILNKLKEYFHFASCIYPLKAWGALGMIQAAEPCHKLGFRSFPGLSCVVMGMEEKAFSSSLCFYWLNIILIWLFPPWGLYVVSNKEGDEFFSQSTDGLKMKILVSFLSHSAISQHTVDSAIREQQPVMWSQ